MNEKATCKAALAKYRDLTKLTVEAQVALLDLLMHPDCTDEQVLEAVHARRKTVSLMRTARDTLVHALRGAGMTWEANALARARI